MQMFDRTDKSDHPRCRYCGSPSPENGFTETKVIHRGEHPYTGKPCAVESRFTVCRGTPCAGRLQMAYEG